MYSEWMPECFQKCVCGEWMYVAYYKHYYEYVHKFLLIATPFSFDVHVIYVFLGGGEMKLVLNFNF